MTKPKDTTREELRAITVDSDDNGNWIKDLETGKIVVDGREKGDWAVIEYLFIQNYTLRQERERWEEENA